MRVRSFAPLVALAFAGLVACQGAAANPSELVVFAAASLRDALEEVRTAYAEVEPGLTLTVSTDSSAALRTQIEQGAPADVFLSADTVHPQVLADAGLAEGPPVAFAANRLAIVVPADDGGSITSWTDLARPGLRIVAAGPDVPISRYVDELVANLAARPDAPPGFAAGYAANVTSREDNVHAVLAKVSLGEGDAGIVYATDATAAGERVRQVPIPAEANVRATYAGVVVAVSPRREGGRLFLAWLVGPSGAAVLTRAGFEPPAG